LAQDAQPALTLRLVCGVSTADIGRAFLVSESTMAARLTRAKKKISRARIPYRVPEAAELPDRLRAVLGVIHLLFTTGHTAPSGASLIRTDLADQALHLARMLRDLMPDEREARGLLALLLVTDARRSTRVDQEGRLLRLEEQDRSRWDRSAIAEAHDRQPAVGMALTGRGPEPYGGRRPGRRTRQALAEIERLERDGRLSGCQYLPAVKADLLQRLGRTAEALVSYREALDLTRNEAEREFLTRRLNAGR
jgi:predicted RNA polymerase sigma factor